jgi:hypothetical protein
MQFRFAVGAGVVLAGCSGGAPEQTNLETTRERLELWPNITLKAPAMNVCFMADGSTPLDPASECAVHGASQTAKVNWLKTGLQTSWQQNSQLRFTFLSSCSGAPAGTIQIYIHDTYPRRDANNNIVRDANNNFICDVINDWHSLGGSSSFGGAIDMSMCAAGTSCDSEQERLQGVVIHEFGHVLGFPHEQQRVDSPYLTSYAPPNFQQSWPGYCNPGANPTPGALAANWNPVNGWELTTYDQNSIMNYCRDQNNNQTGDVYEAALPEVNLAALSKSDIDGVQAAYGFPSVTNSAAPINCGSGAVMLAGDFDADGVSDYLCKSSTRLWGRNGASASTFSVNTTWCTGSTEKLMIGDFSGDRRDDLLCVTSTGIVADYASTTFSSAFGTIDATNPFWTTASNVSYYLGNFDNFAGQDIARIDLAAQTINVVLSLSPVTWNAFIPAGTPCLSSGSASIAIADINGDLHDDIVCVAASPGRWYAYLTGIFGTWDFVNALSLPAWRDRGAYDTDASLHADFDGDGKQDFLFPRADGLAIRFGRSFVTPPVEPTWSTMNSDWSGPFGSLFGSNVSRVIPARVNSDTRTDLIVYKKDYSGFTKVATPSTFHAP